MPLVRVIASPTSATVGDSVNSISGTWLADETGDSVVTFSPDGTGQLDILECSAGFEWSLDDDVLQTRGLDTAGIPCDSEEDGSAGVTGGGALLLLTSEPRLRIDDSFLHTSSQLGVSTLTGDGSG